MIRSINPKRWIEIEKPPQLAPVEPETCARSKVRKEKPVSETNGGNTDLSSTNGFTFINFSQPVGVLTAGGPMPAKVTDPKADLTGTPKTVPQPILNSKSLSDSPPTATVATVPISLPQAENVKRSVSVTGAFGVIKNPA